MVSTDHECDDTSNVRGCHGGAIVGGILIIGYCGVDINSWGSDISDLLRTRTVGKVGKVIIFIYCTYGNS